MQITEITIHPTINGVVGAYVDIVFDNCLKIQGIKVIKGPTGLFISFPSKKQKDGTDWQIAYRGKTGLQRCIPSLVSLMRSILTCSISTQWCDYPS